MSEVLELPVGSAAPLLESLLHLDQATVQALEHNAGDRIDALGDQGQPGG